MIGQTFDGSRRFGLPFAGGKDELALTGAFVLPAGGGDFLAPSVRALRNRLGMTER